VQGVKHVCEYLQLGLGRLGHAPWNLGVGGWGLGARGWGCGSGFRDCDRWLHSSRHSLLQCGSHSSGPSWRESIFGDSCGRTASWIEIYSDVEPEVGLGVLVQGCGGAGVQGCGVRV
jgi:hypothetical protein